MTPSAAPHLILCVEDERRLRGNIVEELVDAGYAVIEADDGQAALELLVDQRPDLILCDITMPRMGGYELLKRVRASGSELADVPFLFLTALSDRLAVIEGKTAGADDYLSKPIDFDLLLATVRSRLDQVVRIRTSLNSNAESQRLAAVDAMLRKGLDDLTMTLEHIALGVVLFDAQKAVLHQNGRAAAMLGTQISFTNGRLVAQSTAQSNELRNALDAAVSNGRNSDLIAVSQDNPHPLLVQFIALNKAQPAGACAAMFLIDTAAPAPVSEALAAKLFNLTRTEARVAAAIARGLRTDEIAQDMGISATTLAFHMRNIFRKAGVSRQQDLMAVMFRSSVLASRE
jgi:DNA-binding NarL/FixJ family response regulator